ncbi:MAG: acetolactate synthase large subunit, partial [Pseudomonadales bacterium]
MNGAESLIRTLLDCGVATCFANPGTSEMHLVQAIDRIDETRAVLCLFEGVCTGAADGYGRMRGAPAYTLLHLGPGLGNGIANLHNARRARSPLINVVGDHAIHHVAYDAPLTSDVVGVAQPMSSWVRRSRTSQGLARDGADAVSATLRRNPDGLGQVATLIVPADCAWGASNGPASPNPEPAPAEVTEEAVDNAARSLDGDSVLLLDGDALGEKGLIHAARIAHVSGCRVMATTFPARVEMGPGRAPVARMPYFPEQVTDALGDVKRLVLAGAEPPVSFFAYRDLPSDLVPDGCEVVRLAHVHEDIVGALEAVADALKAPAGAGARSEELRPEIPSGKLSTRHVAAIVAALLPDNAIVCTDSGGGGAAYATVGTAAPCSFLNLTGGSIGQGGPAATGAAVACPDRQVLALLGDGGAMYTNQALWT